MPGIRSSAPGLWAKYGELTFPAVKSVTPSPVPWRSARSASARPRIAQRAAA